MNPLHILARSPFSTLMKLARGFWFGLVTGSPFKVRLIGRSVSLLHRRGLKLAPGVKLEDYCEIQGLATRGVTLGRNVSIGRYTMIRPSGYYSGDWGEGLEIGDNSSIGPYGYVGCSGFIQIGRDVMFGPGCRLFAENHVFDDPNKSIKSQGVERKSIVIEDNCWIASGVTILAGVHIGEGSIIAAGSVVNKDVPPYSIVGGVPAKVLRSRRLEEVSPA